MNGNKKINNSEYIHPVLNLILEFYTYTFRVNWVCSKKKGSEQRRLGGTVNYSTLLIIGQSTNQNSKHINHECRDESMEDNVQQVKAKRV